MSYIELYQTGELAKDFSAQRITGALPPLSQRRGASRVSGARSMGAGKMRKYQVSPSLWEEHPWSRRWSEQFSLQPALCFRQNFETSRGMDKYAVNTTELAEIMLNSKKRM